MPHGARHRRQMSLADQADGSDYMLALPKSRPRLGNWLMFAILTGMVLALALVALGNVIF